MPVKPVDSPRLALQFIRSLKVDGADDTEKRTEDAADKKAEEAAEKVAEKVEEGKEAKATAGEAGANEE